VTPTAWGRKPAWNKPARKVGDIWNDLLEASTLLTAPRRGRRSSPDGSATTRWRKLFSKFTVQQTEANLGTAAPVRKPGRAVSHSRSSTTFRSVVTTIGAAKGTARARVLAPFATEIESFGTAVCAACGNSGEGVEDTFRATSPLAEASVTVAPV